MNRESIDSGGLESQMSKQTSYGSGYFVGKKVYDADLTPYIEYAGDEEVLMKEEDSLLKKFFFKATEKKSEFYSYYRDDGIYRYGKAVAELTRTGHTGEKRVYVWTNSWDGLKDMKTLQEKIRSGDFPPSKSYENKQTKQSIFSVLKEMLREKKLNPIKRFILAWRLMLDEAK